MFPDTAQTSPPDTQPLWFASFIAGVSAPIACWMVLAVIETVSRGPSLGERVMQPLAMLMMVGVPMCLAVALVFGYPFALILRKLGRLSALNLCAGAVAIGATMATVLAKLVFRPDTVHIAVPAVGAATALFSGIVFCLVAGISFRRHHGASGP